MQGERKVTVQKAGSRSSEREKVPQAELPLTAAAVVVAVVAVALLNAAALVVVAAAGVWMVGAGAG